MTVMPATTIRLSIPPKPEYLVLGRLVLTGVSRSRPIDADAISDLKLALTEACSNSIRHAYDGHVGTVEVLYEISADQIAIEVLDAGSGFQPLPPEARSDQDGDLDEGGLGLEIIRAVADSTEISTRDDGTGSRIRFVKNLQRLDVE